MSGYNPATDDRFRRKAIGGMAIPGWEVPKDAGMYGAQTTATNTPTAPAAPAAPTAAFRLGDYQEPAIQLRRPDTFNDATRRIATAQSWDAENGVPMFNNAGMQRAGYNNKSIQNMNVVPSETVGGMLGSMINPKGGEALSAALQAAAARGDWDAVGRYYASKGESFGGKMYGDNRIDDLYKMAMGGGGVQSTRKRDRAANILNAMNQNQTMLTRQGMSDEAEMRRAMLQAAAQRYGADTTRDAAVYGANERAGAIREAAAERAAYMKDATEQRAEAVKANSRRERIKQYKDPAYLAWINSMKPTDPERRAAEALRIRDYMLEADVTAETAEKLYGVKSFADGGQIQPVLNPMGNMGMPSSMADLDPAVRQYAQYVSTATQYGLQPIAFPKFIDLLGAARSKLMQYPTQGGSGFADGGVVGWLKSFLPGVGPLDTPAPAPAPMPQAQPQPAPTIHGAAQAIQGRSGLNNSALEAAMQARRGYAGGGAIPVAGQQVLGPGGPKTDSIPAVIDGQQPAALSSGEFVMPVEAVKFFGTDKLNKMIQQARGVK